LNKELILRAHKIVDWFARNGKDARSAAMVYMPESYRNMLKVFRSGCFTFNESDLDRWDEVIKILKTQERCKQKSQR
jgi:hypothetical protein